MTGEFQKYSFTPWNDNFSSAIFFCCGAIVVSWFGLFYKYAFNKNGKILILISIALFVVSLALFIKGMIREFGKKFEDKWVKKAVRAFQGSSFTILAPTMTNAGDIDLFVRNSDNLLANVEIKSWRSYGENIKFNKRELQGIKQILLQRKSVGSVISVLWLPQASKGFFKSMFEKAELIGDNIYLCRGGADKLKKTLDKYFT